VGGTGGVDIGGQAGGAGLAGQDPGGAQGGAGQAGSAGAGQAGVSGAGAGGAAGTNAGAGGSDDKDACQILYVRKDGKATGPFAGCTELNALESLDEALKRAADREKSLPAVTEIRVCGGEYQRTVPLVIDRAIAIHGGYDCSQTPWLAATNGSTTATTIHYSSAIGVDLSSPANDAAELTDLTFQASDEQVPPQTDSSIGLWLRPGASATVRRTRFLARGSQVSGQRWGSLGLYVGEGAGGTISNNRFEGGPGLVLASEKALLGSGGAFLDRPAAGLAFQKNTVRGGAGQSQDANVPGSVGLLLVGGKATTQLSDNILLAGTGRYVGEAPVDTSVQTLSFVGSVGLSITSANASSTASAAITEGSIAGGTAESVNLVGGSKPTFTGVRCQSVGVAIQGGQQASVPLSAAFDQVRVYAGDVDQTVAGVATASTFGLLTNTADVRLHSSLVHGGGILATTAYTRAVWSTSSTWTIEGTTVLPGIPTLTGGKVESPESFNTANAIGFFLGGKGNVLTIRSTLIAALKGSTGAFYGEGDDTCGDVAGLGYVVNASRLYWMAPDALAKEPLGFFAGGTEGTTKGTKDCIYLATAPDDTTPQDRLLAHFPVAAPPQPQSVQIFGGALALVTPPTIGSCSDTPTCLAQVFPTYAPAAHDIGIVTNPDGAKGTTFRPVCSDAVPLVLHNGGSLATTPDLDLTGVARGGAVSPGAFDTSCP
jgi:hypothetical protein